LVADPGEDRVLFVLWSGCGSEVVASAAAATTTATVLNKYNTSCGARHNKPRPLLPPTE